MAGSSPEIVRKPRADAVRNRERVLEAAKAVFSAGGSEASLEAVARQAGVSCGTCHVNGANNAKFFMPKMSSRPGTLDRKSVV